MPNPLFRNGKLQTGPITRIGAALGIVIVGLIMMLAPDSSGLTMALAGAITLGGLMFGSLGVKGLFDPDFATEEDRSAGWTADSSEALAKAVGEKDAPFWVCTGCRVIYEEGVCHGICLRCDRPTDCLHVASEDDRSMALASVH